MANVWSPQEVETGNSIDGQVIYVKTIAFGALPDNTSKSVNHNITNLGHIVGLDGFALSSLNKGGITLPHATGNDSSICLYADDTQITIRA